MVLLCTTGLMVHQVSALAVRADLTHSLQETWKATLPHLQLTRCGLMSVPAVRGAAPELDSQLLEFSQRMSLRQ